jgi:hypothetical protein
LYVFLVSITSSPIAFLVLFFKVSSLISFIFFIVSLNVSYFLVSPEYTTHNEYLLHDLAKANLWFFIILLLKHFLFKDLLSTITKFFRSISFDSLSLRFRVFISKSIVNLSDPFLLTKVILLYFVLIDGESSGVFVVQYKLCQTH